ncbi:Galactose-binding domain-like protein [Purpureocillium lavendulum]|uniref:Dehydrogenase FUB6 n=1 Tax=Purpureocillium lavendulum TaxID=1247861 RepID=A0AB34FJ20_9HYPO|nr:Galactose-binding domain-like protein [Purpureocillium lavendulum]
MSERMATWDPENLQRRGIPTKEAINVYRRWGEGGFGLILTGNTMIEYDQLEAAGNLIIPPESPFSGERFEGFKELAAAGKKHGSLIVCQLSHPGRQVTSDIQQHPISASNVQLGPVMSMTFAKPRAMEKNDFDAVINGFVHAAEYCYKAGFDGIQLHGAHGYLLAQFLAPSTNKRTDKYGGSILNRARLIFEINDAIRARVPDRSFSLGIKVNSVEFQEGGFSTDDCIVLCTELENRGFDYVELSGGTYEELAFAHRRESTKKREAFFLDFAEMIIPNLAKTKAYVTGGFRTVAGMAKAISSVHDFSLWINGVGAIAKSGLLLYAKLQSQPDLAMVRSVLLMFSESLDHYAIDNMVPNKTLIYKQVLSGVPQPGTDLVVEDQGIDLEMSPKGGLVVKILYASFDPYLRNMMRDPKIKSYMPPLEANTPVANFTVSRVLKSDNKTFREGDLITATTPIAEYASIADPVAAMATKINNEYGFELGIFLGPLGMPGLTAWSSLHKIGKPKKGETIFISSAAGAIGQVVGQVAKREGLTVIGSVGSDEKLDFITKELGFDGGFNYKKETPLDALQRLAPNGIDIYYDNVGGEHLEAALEVINPSGRVVACGTISEYNAKPEERYGVKNMAYVCTKQILFQGFMVSMPDFGPAYYKEHQQTLSAWLADGSVKAKLDTTNGIDNAAEGFVGMLQGKNFGKAVLKRGYLVTATVRSQEKADDVFETHPSWKGRVDFAIVADFTSAEPFDHLFQTTKVPFNYIIHTASPVSTEVSDIRKEMVRPAEMGTTEILKAANHYGGGNLKRFVLLGSAVSVLNSFEDLTKEGQPYTEEDWNPITVAEAIERNDTVLGYIASKKRAESAAWEFMKDNSPSFDMTVINPDIITGPMIHPIKGPKSINDTNRFTIANLIDGTYKTIEDVAFPFYHFVDVRDVAQSHVDVLQNSAAANKRILLISGLITPQLVANVIRDNLPSIKDRVPQGNPSQILPSGVHPTGWNTQVSLDILAQGTKAGKWKYIDLKTSVVDAVKSMLENHISHSTTGILQEIEAHTHTDGCQSRLTTGAPDQDFSAISDQYRVLIRQLPSKDHIDLLFDIYMREYNWQHYVVDPDIFSSQLEAWINLSFKDGPESLSPDLRVFPAVLFQVIATALLLLPKESHPILDSLKYAKDLAFEDLASEYSEAGSTIVNILGRKAITIDTVVAQSLRASFMKLTGNVIEYWHMIGVAIRHAQELGMHHDSLDPKPRNLSVKSMLENQWLIERRRRLYMSLVICDTYMSVILGRPGAIDWKQGLPSVPLDAPVPLSRSQTTPIPRNDAINPPTPITWTLLIYKLADPLREIRGLDQDGSTQDFSRVDSIQQKLFNLKTPESAIFRLENPDTRTPSGLAREARVVLLRNSPATREGEIGVSRSALRTTYTPSSPLHALSYAAATEGAQGAVHFDSSEPDSQPSDGPVSVADAADKLVVGQNESVGSLKKTAQSDFDLAHAFDYAQEFLRMRKLLGPLAKFYKDPKADDCNEICRNFAQQFVEDAVNAVGSEKDTLERDISRGSCGTTDQKYIISHELARRTSDRRRILDELMNVLIASYETTASLLSNMFFMLAKHPDVWARLRKQTACLDGRVPTYEEIHGFKFLRCCMNEYIVKVIPHSQLVAKTCEETKRVTNRVCKDVFVGFAPHCEVFKKLGFLKKHCKDVKKFQNRCEDLAKDVTRKWDCSFVKEWTETLTQPDLPCRAARDACHVTLQVLRAKQEFANKAYNEAVRIHTGTLETLANEDKILELVRKSLLDLRAHVEEWRDQSIAATNDWISANAQAMLNSVSADKDNVGVAGPIMDRMKCRLPTVVLPIPVAATESICEPRRLVKRIHGEIAHIENDVIKSLAGAQFPFISDVAAAFLRFKESAPYIASSLIQNIAEEAIPTDSQQPDISLLHHTFTSKHSDTKMNEQFARDSTAKHLITFPVQKHTGTIIDHMRVDMGLTGSDDHEPFAVQNFNPARNALQLMKLSLLGTFLTSSPSAYSAPRGAAFTGPGSSIIYNSDTYALGVGHAWDANDSELFNTDSEPFVGSMHQRALIKCRNYWGAASYNFDTYWGVNFDFSNARTLKLSAASRSGPHQLIIQLYGEQQETAKLAVDVDRLYNVYVFEIADFKRPDFNFDFSKVKGIIFAISEEHSDVTIDVDSIQVHK